MTQIKQLIREIVDTPRPKYNVEHELDVGEGNYGTLDLHCPNCGDVKLKEARRMYRCENCGYRLFKRLAARELTAEELTILIKERKVGPLEGFRTKAG